MVMLWNYSERRGSRSGSRTGWGSSVIGACGGMRWYAVVRGGGSSVMVGLGGHMRRESRVRWEWRSKVRGVGVGLSPMDYVL